MLIQPESLDLFYYELKRHITNPPRPSNDSSDADPFPSTSPSTPSYVLILVSVSVDSICGCRILTSLLRSDSLLYKVLAVNGYEDLQSQFASNCLTDVSSCSSLVLINCGGIVDLSQIFELSQRGRDHIRVFVLDSHRPLHLNNLREENDRVVLLGDVMKAQYETLLEDVDTRMAREGLREEEEGDELEDLEEDEEDDEQERERKREVRLQRKRNRAARKEAVKKKVRQDMREERANYYRGSLYGMNVSSVLYILSVAIEKDSNDLLWLAVLGLTDQFVHDRIDLIRYNQWVSEIQNEVVKKNSMNDNDENDPNLYNLSASLSNGSGSHKQRVGFIRFESNEFRFMLLRHWNLFDSMIHSPYIASRMKVWTDIGKDSLRVMLAHLGIPIEESLSDFTFMNETYKLTLKKDFETTASQFYQLNEITFGSFIKQMTPTMLISASDMVYSLAALLEDPHDRREDSKEGESTPLTPSSSWQRNFLSAYDSLTFSLKSGEELRRGITLAMDLQRAIVRSGSSLLMKKKIVKTGQFAYTIIEESPDLQLLNMPLALIKLANFLCDALAEEAAAKKRKGTSSSSSTRKPVVCAALNASSSTYLVVGTMGPLELNASPNTFGVAFRAAADKTKTRFKHDGFDTSIIEIYKDDIHGFFEYLHSGLVAI